MCIIIAKNKGVRLPSEETFRNCFDNNPDGCGIMFATKKEVIIRKGFMSFKGFMKELNKLEGKYNLEKMPMVFHFRIATSGLVDAGNCHPYPVTNNEKDLRKTSICCDMGMAHNGIISEYTDYKSNLNDTQLFVKNFVSVFNDYAGAKMFDDSRIHALIDKERENSRLAFLVPKENPILFGEWEEYDGCYYSNDSYQSYSLRFKKTPSTYSIGTKSGDNYWKEYEKVNSYDGYYDDYFDMEDELFDSLERGYPLDELDIDFIMNNFIATKEDDDRGLLTYEIDDTYIEVRYEVEINLNLNEAYVLGYVDIHDELAEEREKNKNKTYDKMMGDEKKSNSDTSKSNSKSDN